MNPLIDMTPETWVNWQAAHPDAEDDTQLAALRNYIEQAARREHRSEPSTVTAAWLNKKLPRVGVAARIGQENAYIIKAPVTVAEASMMVHANNRAEALRKFAERLEDSVQRMVVTSYGDPEFVSGPEDEDAEVLLDGAPATVDATLAVLREGILLGVVAGPKLCEAGANRVLADFGLPPVPERKRYVVTRPVEGVAHTNVEAYDEQSAQRVAEWRWENQQGWSVDLGTLEDPGAYAVASHSA